MDFLGIEDVLDLHANQIELYGGEKGLRDMGLLDSAISQPRATFGGEYLHADIFEMAAAYLYHVVQNHPFLDGNKRAGLVAALAFLDINGIEIKVPKGGLYNLVIRVATGQTGKAEIAEFFRSHAH